MRSLTLIGAAALVAWVAACGDEPEARPTLGEPGDGPGEAAAQTWAGLEFRLERSELDAARPLAGPRIKLHARFVEYRGSEPQAALARAELRPAEAVALEVGQCAPWAELADPMRGPEPLEFDAAGEHQLELLDVGDLELHVLGRAVRLPLALVPDLVPWVSGVEYVADTVVADPRDELSVGSAAAISGLVGAELVVVDGAGPFLGARWPVSIPALPVLETRRLDELGLALSWSWGAGEQWVELAELEIDGGLVPQVVCRPSGSSLALGPDELASWGLGDGDAVVVTVTRQVLSQVAGAGGVLDVSGQSRLRAVVEPARP